jgi:hypothetical protein
MAVANLVKLPRIQTFWYTTAKALECEEILTVQRGFNFAIPGDGALFSATWSASSRRYRLHRLIERYGINAKLTGPTR